jgi:integrase
VRHKSQSWNTAFDSRSFRLAVRAGKVAVRPEFEMLHVDNARKGFFEVHQFVAVLDQLADYLKPVARAAYITGWRTKSELLNRQWRHVDLNTGWLRLDPGEGKTGEPRAFPLTPELKAILETQRERVREI